MQKCLNMCASTDSDSHSRIVERPSDPFDACDTAHRGREALRDCKQERRALNHTCLRWTGSKLALAKGEGRGEGMQVLLALAPHIRVQHAISGSISTILILKHLRTLLILHPPLTALKSVRVRVLDFYNSTKHR